ncbi:FeoA family protein [uncultured Helicobacter sp.]|uniref:FeoA family protein n=1 Tax=uncultured Helicobacter sp. TaxID=175537 RepID=UPI00374E7B4D
MRSFALSPDKQERSSCNKIIESTTTSDIAESKQSQDSKERILMTLYDCPKNQPHKVLAIHTKDDALRNRLIAMGICHDSTITLCHSTLAKATLCVLANDTQIALRAEEAKEIEVCPIENPKITNSPLT